MALTLDPKFVIETADRLKDRMAERFPERGITQVIGDLCETTREAADVAVSLDRPMMRYRILAGFAILLITAGLLGAFVYLNPNVRHLGFAEMLQTLEAGVNDLIFITLAIFFIVRWERRAKRTKALDMLHQLRSLAHIIDMHQLTKDPDSVGNAKGRTESSPRHDLCGYQLKRYFDYCSEMLSIISKLAAILVQDFDDPVTLAAVNEIEGLTNGLSRKIWQKIMIASAREPQFGIPEK